MGVLSNNRGNGNIGNSGGGVIARLKKEGKLTTPPIEEEVQPTSTPKTMLGGLSALSKPVPKSVVPNAVAPRAFRQQPIIKPQSTPQSPEEIRQRTANSGKIISGEANYNSKPWYSKLFSEHPRSQEYIDAETLRGRKDAEVSYNPLSKNFNLPIFGNMVKGAANSVKGGLRGIVNTIARAPGAKPFRDTNTDWWEESAHDKGLKQRERELYDQKNVVSKFVYDVERGIGSNLPSFLVGGVAGKAAGLVARGVIGGGNYTQNALDSGASANEAATYGAIVGSAEAATEGLFGYVPGLKMLDEGLSGLTGSLKKNAGKIIGNFFKKSAGEGLEELIMDPISAGSEKALYNPDKQWFGKDGVFDGKQMAYDFLVGMGAGSLMGAPQVAGQTIDAKEAQQQIKDNFQRELTDALAMPKDSATYQKALTIIDSGINTKIEDFADFIQTKQAETELMQEMGNVNPTQANVVPPVTNTKPITAQTTNEGESILPTQNEPVKTQDTANYFADDINVATKSPGMEQIRESNETKPVIEQNTANNFYDYPDVIAAREEMKSQTSTHAIDTPERISLRQNIADGLYGDGAKNKNKRIDIVIGPPAAGKSTVLADPLAKEHGSIVIDSDMAKEMLPEFNGGKGAGAVHEESSNIIENYLVPRAIQNGDNIVYPIVGKSIDKLRSLRDTLKSYGYDVHLHLNELAPEKAAQRAIERFRGKSKRFVDPDYVYNSVGWKPSENYGILKEEGGFNGYQKYSNDVPKGQSAKLIESIGASKASIQDGGMGGHGGRRINKSVEKTSTKPESKPEPEQKINKDNSDDVADKNAVDTSAFPIGLKVISKNNNTYTIKSTEVKPKVEKIIQSPTQEPTQPRRKSKATKKEELPNTIPELEAEIKNMEEDKLKLLPINLQLFAEAKQKLFKLKAVSRFYVNTLSRINGYTDEQRNEFLESDGEFTVKTEVESLAEAQERLSKDFDGEVERMKKYGLQNGVDTDVAMAVLEVYKNEGQEIGDFSKMKEWARIIRSKGTTEMGRGIQAFVKYSRTPEHYINEAERIIDDVEESVKEKNSETIESIENETKIIEEVLKEADEKAAEDTVKEIQEDEAKRSKTNKDTDNQEETPEGKEKKSYKKPKEPKEPEDPATMLANRIKQAMKGSQLKEKDVIRKMVDELYQKFKETDAKGNLPGKLSTNNVKEFLEAIKNKDVSDNVWIKAKEIVRENFKDDPTAMEILDNYFGKGTRPPFSDKTAETAINEVMKKLDYKISDIVKDYYATGVQQRTNILEYMKTEGRLQGLKEDEVNVLANYVDAKFKVWKKEYADNYLRNLYKIKNTNPANLEESSLKFIDSAVNAGIFLNQNYSNRVNEKLDPRIRNLIRSSGMKLHELVKKGKDSVVFEREAFVSSLQNKLRLSEEDALRVARVAERVFNEETNKAREQILKGMLKVKKPNKRQRVFDKVLELINLDAYSVPAIRDIIKGKEGIPVLDNEDITKIIDAVNKRNEVEQDSYIYRLMTEKIENLMANKIPATLSDKVKALQRISLLLNPKTNVRNIGGNLIITATENMKDLIGAPIDIIMSRARGSERTTLFNPVEKIKWQYEGSKSGIKENIKDVSNSFDDEFARDMSWPKIYKNLMSLQLVNTSSMNERYQIKKGRVFESDMLSFLDNSVKTVLSFGDRPFFEAAYNMRLKELMKIKGLTKKNSDVDMLAKLYALERVFQNDSELSKRLTKIRDSMGIVGNVVFPFTQTPSNIYDKLLEYTPVGMAKALWELGKLSNNGKVRKVIQGEFDQKIFVDRMARSFTGTGLMLIGGVLAALGLASGGDDKRERARENEKATKQAYSIKIGGKWYSYEQLQPIGGVLAMGVDAYNKSKDKAGFLASINAGFEAAGNTFIRSSFMRNAFDIIGSVAGSNGSINTALTKLFKNATSQTNPTFIRQLSDLSDDYVREVYDPNPVKQFANQYISKIPFVSRTLPKKVDVYGNEIKRFDDANNVLNVMFNPLFIKGVAVTPVQKEITDTFARTNNVNVLPQTEDDVIKFTYKGTTYPLTLDAQQYINYQKLSGRLLTTVAKTVIASEEYKNLLGTPTEYEVKAKLFAEMVNQAHDTSREYMIQQYIKYKIESKKK